MRHILVKTKAQADKIYDQLKAGASFAVLAKKYSHDPGSKNNGGKLTIVRGQTVPPFDATAFKLSTNVDLASVKTQYGYHVIQPISDVKPPTTTPLKDAKAQIQAHAPRQGEERRDHQVDDRHEGVLRQEGHLRDRATRRPRQRPTRRPRPADAVPPPDAVALAEALVELQELTRRLRRDCPWDREQTARTIVPHTVEEAYEVADAANAGDSGEAPRRARRPALPDLLPRPAARGAGPG